MIVLSAVGLELPETAGPTKCSGGGTGAHGPGAQKPQPGPLPTGPVLKPWWSGVRTGARRGSPEGFGRVPRQEHWRVPPKQCTFGLEVMKAI